MNTLVSESAQSGPEGSYPAAVQALRIRGGHPLRGTVDVKGAKNLATKAMVAALLGETASTLRDVPDISDVQVVRSLLEVHGAFPTSRSAASSTTSSTDRRSRNPWSATATTRMGRSSTAT